jgi:histidinol-phosphatase (PHP family)
MKHLVDLHTHHYRCGHAEGELEDYVAHAAEHGFAALGLSDHAPLFADPQDQPLPRIHMARSDYPNYLREGRRLRERYAERLQVRVGIEADYIEGTEGIYREALAQGELDYVLGSVHTFAGFHVYQPHTWPPPGERAGLFAAYFDALRKSARSGMFDILAHIDAVKVFGPEVFEVAGHEIEPTLDAIAESGAVVEFNTAGIRKCGEVFPNPELVRGLVARGVPFTFGSDAHRPMELGYAATEVVALCRELGIREFAVFAGRERSFVPLPVGPAAARPWPTG